MARYLINNFSVLISRSIGWLVIIVVGAVSTLPAFLNGNVIGHDILYHLVISQQFSNQFLSGELYPRWLSGLNNSLGSPVMFFYGPMSYYVASLFRIFGFGDSEGWHQLGLAATAAVIASGLTSYAWLKKLGNKQAALLGALLYMTAPYHLMVDLYQRFAFAELWSFAWLPLILLQVHLIIEKKEHAFFVLAFCYAILIMTHLPTTLLFSFIPPLYAYWIGGANCRRAGIKVIVAMILGIGLSSIFLFPALMMLRFVRIGVMENGQFYFANNFLFYGARFTNFPNEDIKFIGIVMALALLVVIGVYVLGKSLFVKDNKKIAGFWFWVGVFVFFMMLQPSKFIWELIPILQQVQFPSRFGTILSISMVVMIVLWLNTADRLLSKNNAIMLTVVGLIGLIHSVMLFKEYMMYPAWSQPPSLNWLYDRMSGKGELVKAVVEAAKLNGYTYFLPNESDPGLRGDSKQSLLTLRKLSSMPPVTVAKAVTEHATVKLQHVASRHLQINAESGKPASLIVRQFYFPGWVATVKDTSSIVNVRPNYPSGLIEIDIPAGMHVIDLELTAGPAERIGRLISLLSIVFLVAGWARLHYLAKRGNRLLPDTRASQAPIQVVDQSSSKSD